jgi:Fe-S cluster assembly protein SufD
MSPFTPDRSAALDGPAWLRARRAAAAERFAAGELPTAEDELWRYTPIKALDLDTFQPVLGASVHRSGGETRPERSGGWVEGITERAATVVIEDGRLVSAEVSASGVTVSVAGDDELALLEVPDRNALDDLHDAFVGDVVVVRIADGAFVEHPIVILQVASAGGAASFPHVVVEAGAQSEATVVDVWLSSGDGPSYVSPVVEVRGGAASNVRYVGVQDLGTEAWSNAHLVLRPARDATAKAWVAALGGSFARLYATARLEEQAAAAEIKGVYFGESDQVLDFRSVQDHVASRSASDLLLKGAVVDDAHAVYTGMIKVHEGAKATASFLANRNLVLSEGAHVDSVPNLEIVNENDIKSCGHAAATGPVDEEHVFYLESRGVPTDVAERLIVFGFFDEVVRGIPVPELHEPLRAAITRKLSHV